MAVMPFFVVIVVVPLKMICLKPTPIAPVCPGPTTAVTALHLGAYLLPHAAMKRPV